MTVESTAALGAVGAGSAVTDEVWTGVLRAAAVRLSGAGVSVWPVCPATGRLVSGRPAAGPVVARWWWDRPYGIGFLAGEGFDVIEVPARLGPRLLPVIGHAATVWEAITAAGRVWRVFVTGGSPVVFEFRHLVPGARLHTDGTLLMLPPTPGDACRWVAREPGPGTRLQLPHSLTTQWAAINAARAARSQDIE